MWTTYPQCGNVDNSPTYPQRFPQVIHIAGARQRIGLSELSTFPHRPTTTTTSFKLIVRSSKSNHYPVLYRRGKTISFEVNAM